MSKDKDDDAMTWRHEDGNNVVALADHPKRLHDDAQDRLITAVAIISENAGAKVLEIDELEAEFHAGLAALADVRRAGWQR